MLEGRLIESVGKKPCLLAIAGGKGGVGKTILTAAMGMALAQSGHRTIVVDADFGGPNLHQVLGITNPLTTIRDFLEHRSNALNPLLLTTFLPDLYLISGTPHCFGMADLKCSFKFKLIRHLRALSAEYVLLDLGAGTAFNELDYFLASDQGVIVITPEPLAVQNGFHFLKLCLWRRLARLFIPYAQIRRVLHAFLEDGIGKGIATIPQISAQVRRLGDGHYDLWRQAVEQFKPQVILNMMENEVDLHQAVALQIAARDLLDLRLDVLHTVRYDDSWRQAGMQAQPEWIMNRSVPAWKDVQRLVQRLHARLQPKVDFDAIAPAFELDGEPAPASARAVICSHRCSLWNTCSVRRGGYSCRVQMPGYVHQRTV
ncbi:MAG TPA: P-loop NTPase [bacterium]|mgnify:CR=1 FL=1|nr:P-loop NTPase [bacterium]